MSFFNSAFEDELIELYERAKIAVEKLEAMAESKGEPAKELDVLAECFSCDWSVLQSESEVWSDEHQAPHGWVLVSVRDLDDRVYLFCKTCKKDAVTII